VRSKCDDRTFHKQELLRHRWQDIFVYKKHQTEEAKWKEDASKREGHLSVVSQMKQFDLMKLKLEFSGRASVGKRRGTVLEHV
jgi:hypothetical protein